MFVQTQPTPSRKLLTFLEYKADLLVIEDRTTTGGSGNVQQLIFPENNLPLISFALKSKRFTSACNSTMIRLREEKKNNNIFIDQKFSNNNIKRLV